MNKPELEENITVRLNTLPLNVVKACVNIILESISEELAKGGRCEFRGFGAWHTKTIESRNARNPKTGEKLVAPEKKKVRFKMGMALREGVNK